MGRLSLNLVLVVKPLSLFRNTTKIGKAKMVFDTRARFVIVKGYNSEPGLNHSHFS